MVFKIGPGFWSWEKTAELAPPRADRNGPREYSRALIRTSGGREGHLEPCNESTADVIGRGMGANSVWSEADMVGDPSTRAEEGWRVHNETWASCNTPLHMAMASPAFEKAAHLLILCGADADRRNACGETVLYQWSDDPRKVSLLLRLGADPNARTEESSVTCLNKYVQDRPGGLPPLFCAIASGAVESCRLLLNARADVNMALPGRWALLDYAVLRRDREIVQVLLEKGAVFSSFQETVQVDEDHTHSPSQKHIEALAKRLLIGQKELLHPDARLILDLIVLSDDIAHLMDSDMDGREKSEALISAVYDKLSSLAHSANPHRPPVPHCGRCAALQSDSLLWTGQRAVTVLWGTVADLESSTAASCPLCRLLFKPLLMELKSKRKSFEDQEEVAIRFNGKISQVQCGKVSRLFVIESLADDFTQGFEMLDRSAGTSSPASMAMARRWLDHCESAHVGTCSHCPRMPGEPPELPSRVIDVGDTERLPFLVETRGFRSEYFALSYCWGQTQVPALRTEKASLLQHLKAIPMKRLPKTIQDAIVVTRKMGMRYLWIDSLCIIQDDRDDWAYEAARMQQVYLNARLVLSALASDSSHDGLFRDAQSDLPPFVQLSLLAPADKPASSSCLYALPCRAADGAAELAGGPITKRAWVLQEESLAARVLYFGAEMLYWECLALTASESEPDGLQWDGGRLPRKENRARRKWLQKREFICDCHIDPVSTAERGGDRSDGSLYQAWEESVALYTRRSLSKHTDRIPAILGLGLRMQSALHCRFVAGIWTGAYALRSLCWQVTGQPGRPVAHCPSWSWASTTASTAYKLLSSQVLRTTTVEWVAKVIAIETDQSPSQDRVSGRVRIKGLLKKNPGPLRKGNIGGFDATSHCDTMNSDAESTTSEPLPLWSDSDLDSEDGEPEDNTSRPVAPPPRRRPIARTQPAQRREDEPEGEEGVEVLLDRPSSPSLESYFLAVARTKRRLPDIGLDENWEFVQRKNETHKTTICLVVEPLDSKGEIWRRVGICAIEAVASEFWDDAVEREVAIV